jgi:hypothetical protein
VHGSDLVGQPRVSDRACGWRPNSGVVVPGPRDPEREARLLDENALSREFGGEAVAHFWGHHLLDRGGRFTQDLDFVLEFSDPSLRRGECGGLDGSRTRALQATIGQVLGLPTMQARFRDPQRRGNVADRASRAEQIKSTATELRRVRLPGLGETGVPGGAGRRG